MQNSINLKESIFSNIPTELSRKYVFIMEGIRYAYGMIDLTFENLQKVILKASVSKEVNNLYCYEIFKEAWSIIDLSWRLRNIICLFNSRPDEIKENVDNPIDITFFNSIREFRNTLQHIDERINEVLIPENTYLWGTLSWIYTKDIQTFYSILLAPGHPRPGHPRGFGKLINPAGQTIYRPISHITLNSINRQKLEISLNLTELRININQMMLEIESVLKPQIEKMDNSKRFAQDLMIVVKMAPVMD